MWARSKRACSFAHCDVALRDAGQCVGQAFDLVLDVKHIASLAYALQANTPRVSVTMLDGFKHIAVRRRRIDIGEH
jgi:hypothetical protein